MLQLYYALGACSLASHIALEEAGAPYEGVRIDLKAGDQRQPDYIKVNPKGRVPALVTERGILTENPAILAFIAQAFRPPSLRRSMTRLPLRRCSRSTPICAPPSMLRTRIARAARGGSTPMMRRRLRR